MWGIIPAAGAGSRIQPLAFSKELLPVGCRRTEGVERPRAVSEYLIDRFVQCGADKICFVISPGKCDILEYYGSSALNATFAYTVQDRPAGLCDAIFRAIPLINEKEDVVVGLPDTIWFPENGLCYLPNHTLSFLLFPVQRPELFDAVVTDDNDVVREIQVKKTDASTCWVWGAFRMPGHVFHELYNLWREPGRNDEYMGTLVNEWIARGGTAYGIHAGMNYVDVGTLGGYRAALNALAAPDNETTQEVSRS
jgi:dTDP-glucose pyrophosphorylase